jgi:serine beta-lactamase-like protein LACTB, mitochondrial
LKIRTLALFTIVPLLILFEFTDARPAKSEPVERAKSLVEEFRTVAGVPGMSVAVGINNAVVWDQGFGSIDLENNVAATGASKFRLGSVSKIIAIAAAMRLVERGLLDLDAPISKYVSDLPAAQGKITVRQLAGHLGGVRHYKMEDSQYDLKHSNSVKESLNIFIKDPLLQEPGTKYLYSTFGFVLLSAAMEGAASKNFLQIVNDEVIQPLRLSSMGPDLMKDIIADKSRYYQREKGKIGNAPYEDPSYKWAGAGMISSAADLARFGMAHLAPGYLNHQTLETMFQSQKTADGKETGVGLAWRIGLDWKGRKIYHHAGNIAGGRAVLILYPESRLAIALMSNVSGQPAFVESTAQLIAEGFLPDASKPFAGPDLSGKYELSGSNNDKAYTANLELHRNKKGYKGSFSGAFPLLDAAVKNEMPASVVVCSVWMKEKTPALVLVSPFGMLEMILERNETGYRYKVEEGPAKFEGHMKRVHPE